MCAIDGLATLKSCVMCSDIVDDDQHKDTS